MDNRPEQGEIELHNLWAESVVVREIDVVACMEGVNAVENRFLIQSILRRYGRIEGLRIADIGTGLGESAVYFAKQGASVIATDASSGMVEVCRKLAAVHGVEDRIEASIADANNIPFVKGGLDVVYTANLLHHLADPVAFLRLAAQALKNGGLFLSYDPILSNPAVQAYRMLAKSLHTDHERPLRLNFVGEASKVFSTVVHREFWLFAQMLFLKYFLFDRSNPATARYWKMIHKKGTNTGLWTMRILHLMDRIPLSLPLVRRWAWNMAISAVK